jgi:hypothetical protein
VTPLREKISAVRQEAEAQRRKAAELRRRATWWRPLTRTLMRLDADALEHGAGELERYANRWDVVATLYEPEILVVDLGPPLDLANLDQALERALAELIERKTDA